MATEPEHITLQFDGGSRGNPGDSGSGYVILNSDSNVIAEGYSFLGTGVTNNHAEYYALILGLRHALKLQATEVIVEGDSMLVISHLQGKWKVKAANLKPLYEEARSLLKQLPEYKLRHIPRSLNSLADALANKAMDTKQSFATA